MTIRFRVAAALLALVVLTQRASAQLVTNGGFETGNLSDWTLTGSDCSTNIASIGAHTGAFGYYSGPVLHTCALSQSFATTAGAQYTFSFWVQNNFIGAGSNSFDARWDGGSVYSLVDAPAFTFVQQMFTVAATGATTTIEFTIRNDPTFYLLDDVSVVAKAGIDDLSTVPEPSTYALMAAGLLGVAVARRRRRVA